MLTIEQTINYRN